MSEQHERIERPIGASERAHEEAFDKALACARDYFDGVVLLAIKRIPSDDGLGGYIKICSSGNRDGALFSADAAALLREMAAEFEAAAGLSGPPEKPEEPPP